MYVPRIELNKDFLIHLYRFGKKSAKILQFIYFRECGAKVEILTAKQIKRKFPWLHTDDIALGCYGYESEGWFDPWALLTGMYVSFILKYLKILVVIEIYFLFFSHENEV